MNHNDSAPLVVHEISKSYGTHAALRGISFCVQRASCVGLLGPNGAGKTTAIKICMGASRADAGRVSVLGLPMPDNALAARAQVGVVPQSNILDPDFNCTENLAVYARYFGIDQKTAHQRIPSLLEFAGLTKRDKEPINSLSGGMQRRLTLARALINDPLLIFMDEPTTGLDPQARHLIWERTRRLLADGKTILLTTHFLEEAERLCDIVYIMDAGRIITAGAPLDLIAEHVEKEVVELQDNKAAAWLDEHSAIIQRRECFGELIYCYCANADDLVLALRQADFRFTRRRTNLEDVFLRLTGRELRE